MVRFILFVLNLPEVKTFRKVGIKGFLFRAPSFLSVFSSVFFLFSLSF